MLNDVNINTESLKQINLNIQKYSNNPKKSQANSCNKNLFSQINKQCNRERCQRYRRKQNSRIYFKKTPYK